MTTESIDQFAERMVRNEVLCCVSALVSTLATGYGDPIWGRDLSDLVEQAFELASPVLDYESAAIAAGWSRNTHNGMFVAPVGHYPRMTDHADWQSLCAEFGIEPRESKIYKHWAVSTWFAEKLAEKGEKVDTDFAGLNVWARQSSEQGIAADSVVLEIARECMSA